MLDMKTQNETAQRRSDMTIEIDLNNISKDKIIELLNLMQQLEKELLQDDYWFDEL